MRWAAMFLALAMTESAVAQTPTPMFCVRPGAAPKCGAFAIMELSYSRVGKRSSTLVGDPRAPERFTDFENRIQWAVGAARTLPRGRSIGAAVILNRGGPLLNGVEARYRRISDDPGSPSLELSGGLAFGRFTKFLNIVCVDVCEQHRDVVGQGLRAGVTLSPFPELAAILRGEWLRADGQNRSAFYYGLSLNGGAAIGGSMVMALLASLGK